MAKTSKGKPNGVNGPVIKVYRVHPNPVLPLTEIFRGVKIHSPSKFSRIRTGGEVQCEVSDLTVQVLNRLRRNGTFK